MKLIPVTYYGFTAMDRRFSSPMLPWVVYEIRKRSHQEKLSVGIENGVLQAYNPDFELQFTHKLNQVNRFSHADQDPTTFLYILCDDSDTLFYCYLFQAKHKEDVSELYKQMKEQSGASPPTRSISSAANLTSLCVDISPSSSNFFEVLYIGKIKVWQKKVPDSFIDDALEKFKVHEIEKSKAKMFATIGRLRSEDNIRRSSIDNVRRGSIDNTRRGSDDSNRERSATPPHLQRSMSSITPLALKPPPDQRSPSPDAPSHADIDEHNRTMVLQVDRTDFRLISPDRKVILLHKHHRDLTGCMPGLAHADHFGFICRESAAPTPTAPVPAVHIGYIFKCESASIAGDAVAALTQAFGSADLRPPRAAPASCDHCPMIWFHKLCTEVEHLSDRKTQAAILRKIDDLEADEQGTILAKFRGAETDSMREQNEFLMMLLRAHCESKQLRHVHDTAENRSEFLNQYLGGSGGGTIFMKAKRSLTNSFELLKRKASKDDFGASLREANAMVNREVSPGGLNTSESEGEAPRSRSSTIGSEAGLVERTTPEKTVPKSPMMDIFLKVGSGPKTPTEDSPTGSWRQAIFKKVITPSKLPLSELDTSPISREPKTKAELRELWRKAIYQAILLVRMEKENTRLKAEQEGSALKRIKLEYDEMKPSQMREVMDVWEIVTNKETRGKCDQKMLLHAIRQGVPRGKRGDVWQFLAEQYCMKVAPIDISAFPNYNVGYETLLKQLTAHQHAILIDLGRTFPNHSYFSSPLGPGQLALFNLLKAYSLLDSEMGYCQGMSFVAGVLLLHMEESQAFFLLRHLMFRRGLRNQYLPDMVGLQVKLYQLSRLLHDQLPELYNHFNTYEVAPTLYAAPWLLTIFASQFPLGFVTRVFDLIFLESPDVIFRVAIALLTHHRDALLVLDNFEEIMNYLKVELPQIDKPVLDKIMKQVFTTDISKQLYEYQVEYQVLQEELTSIQPHVETIAKLQKQNHKLIEQTKSLSGQLELALNNSQRFEQTRTLQQNQINRLEMQNRALDVTIATLGNFITALVETNSDVDLPDDVRRILHQISFSERRKSPQSNNLLKMFENGNKMMVKSLSTGKIILPAGLQAELHGRSNSLNAQTIQEEFRNNLNNNLNAGGSSKFFSNSHNHILQQTKLQQSSPNLLANINNNNVTTPKIDIKIQEFGSGDGVDKVGIDVSPSGSVDSGVGTPQSPKVEPHPLSNCDVNFTFNGTRELKNFKSIRNMSRNSSPDIIGK